MNPRQHAFCARALQDACGGADACLNVLDDTPFKMGRTHLYDTRDPSTGRTMPIGAVAFLEKVCRRKIYTEVISAQVDGPTDAECAVSEACEITETGAQLQRLVREAASDGVFSEHEKREIEQVLQLLQNHIAGVRSCLDEVRP
ncbi:MAG: hypothetical protein EBR82_02815 [Caulobacteraceae bacterium]|nr:hypothetical protein [Caulobacteraceae bacterium]